MDWMSIQSHSLNQDCRRLLLQITLMSLVAKFTNYHTNQVDLMEEKNGLLHVTVSSKQKWNLLLNFHLQEVEREISFRTECGLYYSYYKQMIQAASIQQGIVNCEVSFTSCCQQTVLNVFSNMIEDKECLRFERWCNDCTGNRFVLFIHQGATKIWT